MQGFDAFLQFFTTSPLLTYTSGLIIVGCLLMILWGLIKQDQRESLPLFCQNCQFKCKKLIGDVNYCRKRCLYNPLYRRSAHTSHFKKK